MAIPGLAPEFVDAAQAPPSASKSPGVGFIEPMAESLLTVPPTVAAPLDPGFRPAWLGNKAFRKALGSAGVALGFALERSGGARSVYSTTVFPAGHALAAHNLRYAERILKFLLWQKGAFKVTVVGAAEIAAALGREYAPGGARAFDAEFFAKIYETPRFIVESASALPPENEPGQAVGGHLDGCRIGFDAGGSDRKVAAVIDGREVFSCEVVWEPKLQSDPAYHFAGIDDSIRRAAEHLPRIDAIGVSSAGVYVDKRTMVASLFRKVPEADFNARIKSIYLDIAKKWGDVPIEVANDGDVTALAGAMDLGDRPVLGIAMGTSEAVGYVNEQGLLTGWLNELAFAPVDYGAEASVDSEWSGDRGTGVGYFSQDAVIRLAPRAGIELDATASPGEKLKTVQNLLLKGDERAGSIFETLGVYLGYGLLHYADFYPMKHVLLLGRVTSGEGGNLLLAKAREVLDAEAPELAARLFVHLPDESKRRVGQSIAAASLPKISR
jgi:predicted NBD/HSP70 family sugar kinase